MEKNVWSFLVEKMGSPGVYHAQRSTLMVGDPITTGGSPVSKLVYMYGSLEDGGGSHPLSSFPRYSMVRKRIRNS